MRESGRHDRGQRNPRLGPLSAPMRGNRAVPSHSKPVHMDELAEALKAAAGFRAAPKTMG